MSTVPSIVWFADVDTQSEQFGKQSKHLARLAQAKFPLLPGFIITTKVYTDFLQQNNLEPKIKQILSTIAIDRPDSLMQGEHHIRKLFEKAELSEDLISELAQFYDDLGGDTVQLCVFETGNHDKKHRGKKTNTFEDLVNQLPYFWAEMFGGNALWHRHQRHFDHFAGGSEIVVQKRIEGDKTGQIFTCDPQTQKTDKLVIVTDKPTAGDSYLLSKKNLSILDRKLHHKTHTEKLTLDEILALAKMAKRVEEHLYFPQAISWIIDEDKIYISEVKPVTALATQKPTSKPKLSVARGNGRTPFIGTGIVRIASRPSYLRNLKADTVLVIAEIHAKQVSKLKKIRGIVTENNPSAETIILLRQHGIPTISKVKNATQQFHNGHIITVHGTKGEIYLGGLLS